VPNAVNLPPSSLNAPELQRLTSVSGAAGRLLAVLSPERPDQFTLTVRGQVASDVAEHVLGTALSEALLLWTDQRVTPVNARIVAEEVSIDVRTQADDSDQDIVPTFSFSVRGATDHLVMMRWDRADAGIMAIDGFSLEHPLAGVVLITHHRDQPGMIGQIGMIMGRYDVNIAGMQVGRHEVTRGGEAIMVLNVDDEIPLEAVAEIEAIDGIEAAYVVSLPEALNHPVQASLLSGLA
jgi:D-3-phosphoglycerate dehydrogenase